MGRGHPKGQADHERAEIEKAVAMLSPEDFAAFRAWFGELAADRWDEQIERDIKAGKLDALA